MYTVFTIFIIFYWQLLLVEKAYYKQFFLLMPSLIIVNIYIEVKIVHH